MNEIHKIANLSIKQAAEVMGVSVSTVKRRMREGLPYVKEPRGNIKFSVADIIEWQGKYRKNQEKETDIMTPEKALAIVAKIR